jgi:RimJ/RimL family protein N-acetyltransferase
MIADYPEYADPVAVDADAAGVDLFIGEAAHLHHGLGSHILRAFLREIVFGAMGAGSCIIGPDERNAIAIRSYEKAGFHYLKTVQIPDEDAPEYLMRITPAEL